jgi:uncharacterized damage-inducible protein DinB
MSVTAALRSQSERLSELLANVTEETSRGLTYAPGKWTLKEVLGHLIDYERIFTYRALCFARGEWQQLPGYDGNEYAAMANFEARKLAEVTAEYRAVRAATLALLDSLDDEAWLRHGVASGYPVSVRGLADQIAAHELHHLAILQSKYVNR